MKVILDTTELCKDFKLAHPNFKYLESYLLHRPAQLVVPKIVIDETTNHFREAVDSAIEKAEGALQSLRGLLLKSQMFGLNPIDRAAEVAAFSNFLNERLSELGAECPNYEHLQVATLVQRALNRRKPFDSEGRAGFRDAVLWETVLSVMKESTDEIIFVTRNKKDFGDHGRLAEHLRDELSQLRIDAGRVNICEGLDRFVNEYVKPGLLQPKAIASQIQNGQFGEFRPGEFFETFQQEVKTTVDELLKQSRLLVAHYWCNGEETGSRVVLHQPELRFISDIPFAFVVNNAWEIEGDDVGVGITFHVEASICSLESEQEWGELILEVDLVINKHTGKIAGWGVTRVGFSVERPSRPLF